MGGSPRKFTVGGYHGSLPQEFTMGGHHAGVSCGMLPLATIDLPWVITAGIYRGSLMHRSLSMLGHHGSYNVVDSYHGTFTTGASLHYLSCGYHWLPLATIDLVGDNRGFEVFRHILSCYTHYSWLLVLDLQSFITICPWLPLVAPSNHWFRWVIIGNLKFLGIFWAVIPIIVGW